MALTKRFKLFPKTSLVSSSIFCPCCKKLGARMCFGAGGAKPMLAETPTAAPAMAAAGRDALHEGSKAALKNGGGDNEEHNLRGTWQVKRILPQP